MILSLNINFDAYKIAANWPPFQVPNIRIWNIPGCFWKDIEKTAGVYDFTYVDQTLTAAQGHGIDDAIYTLGEALPSFYTYANAAAPCAAFISNLVKHVQSLFPNFTLWIEEWNEPELHGWVGSGGTWPQLVTLTRAVYAALQPLGVKALSPCGAGGYTVHTAPYFTACAGNYPFDIFSYHAYLSDSQRNANHIGVLLGNLVAAAPQGMPIWLTEGSWGAEKWFSPPLSDTEKTAYLQTMYNGMIQYGIARFDWYIWGATAGHDPWGQITTTPNAPYTLAPVGQLFAQLVAKNPINKTTMAMVQVPPGMVWSDPQVVEVPASSVIAPSQQVVVPGSTKTIKFIDTYGVTISQDGDTFTISAPKTKEGPVEPDPSGEPEYTET